ncbi:MAG: TonB-dependent receptor [Verrucomicrobiota bacterium]
MKTKLPLLFLTAGMALAGTPAPTAQSQGEVSKAIRLEEIEVTEKRTSALTQAPTESRLEAMQPQSVVDVSTINNAIAPSADYTMIANLTPSVTTVQANGPGLSEAKNIIRGFTDGQYNITFDGIPFSDNNSFSHHSTSYFPAKLLGQMIVDRGPGTASTIGQATFGGTMAMLSKDPRTTDGIVPTVSYGSFRTLVAHLEGSAANFAPLGGSSTIASYQYLTSDGFLTHSYERRHTIYFKHLQPVGKRTTLTFLTTANWIKFGTPPSVTQATIDARGRDFGLVDDPNSTLSPLYNYQKKEADFSYVGLDTDLGGGWRVANKVGTYLYDNDSYQTPTAGTKTARTNIGGTYQLNYYRAWFDHLNLIHEDDHGTFKTGGWGEYVRNDRFQYLIDYTRGGVLDYNPATTPEAVGILSATTYLMKNYMRTAQVFAEYEWRPLRDLSVNGGIRYAHFRRDIEAPVNQTTRLRYYGERTDTNSMPSLSANYRFRPEWSAYAQIAKGFLAPNLQLFYVPDPSKNNVKPQETTNYQVGTVYKTGRLNADIDAYWIDYRYLPLTITDTATSQQYYALASGAYYSGIESQATVSVGGGLSVHANGSINRAVYKKSKIDIPGVSRSTAVLGFVYNKGGFFTSLSDKFVGEQKVYAAGLNPDFANTLRANVVAPSRWSEDLAVGYSHRFTRGGFLRSLKIKVQIDNLLDRQQQVIGSISATAVPSYIVLPGRNYFFTFSGEF